MRLDGIDVSRIDRLNGLSSAGLASAALQSGDTFQGLKNRSRNMLVFRAPFENANDSPGPLVAFVAAKLRLADVPLANSFQGERPEVLGDRMPVQLAMGADRDLYQFVFPAGASIRSAVITIAPLDVKCGQFIDGQIILFAGSLATVEEPFANQTVIFRA